MSKAITAWPWGIEQAAETLWVGPLRPDGEKVEQVVVALNYDAELTTAAKTRQLSNALLIAAAPELLAACQNIAPLMGAYKNDNCMWAAFSQIVAAITKATQP